MRRLLVISPRPPAAVVVAGALSKWELGLHPPGALPRNR